MLTRRSQLEFLALAQRNPTLGSSSPPNPGPALRGPRGWVELRKKCSTRLNDHTKCNLIRTLERQIKLEQKFKKTKINRNKINIKIKQLIDFLFEQILKISIFACFSTHFFVYFDVSCNALTCIQNSKKNKDKNKNKSLIKIKKIKLRQIVFELVANLDKTSLRNSFAKFYNFGIKFLRNFKLSTRLLNNNVISCHFTFVRALLTYIFLKNKERKNAYKRQKRIYNEDKKDRTS